MQPKISQSTDGEIDMRDVYAAADGIAPFFLSGEYCEKYGFHDNSGIQLDCGGKIHKILFSLDLSAAAVARAEEIGADCIFTHHPAIFHPLYCLTAEGAGAQILACAAAHIGVISAHLNLDCAEGGIDESLMDGLGGDHADAYLHSVSRGHYGRVYNVAKQPLEAFVNQAKSTLATERVVVYGNGYVKRAASFCGAGMDEDAVSFALRNGADTFVSSDPKHHLVAELIEKGLNVVLLTHYAAELYGFKRFYRNLKNALSVECEFFVDERYL